MPLTGLRVIDLTRIPAGPFCSMLRLALRHVPHRRRRGGDRVMTLPEVFANPQIRDQEMVVASEHPGHGEVKILGFPIKFTEAPCRIRRPAPDLAADTDTMLHDLGYSKEEIVRLRRDGVV
jgi:crotonobetainyl-CoA:carnitine CoA-transferase CaiB-like acyl-CoA transferase